MRLEQARGMPQAPTACPGSRPLTFPLFHATSWGFCSMSQGISPYVLFCPPLTLFLSSAFPSFHHVTSQQNSAGRHNTFELIPQFNFLLGCLYQFLLYTLQLQKLLGLQSCTQFRPLGHKTYVQNRVWMSKWSSIYAPIFFFKHYEESLAIGKRQERSEWKGKEEGEKACP